ncbi:MAG: GNAT family N-acetyltransferase [Flavobacteriales bacterium]|jgi:GNAT superfamily N-acetyltransferase|nr:GNAT family N-acetyltransferase [Flavobacteriales bacterium]
MILRKATPNDMHAVHQLITELAIFEKEPEAVATSPEELLRDGFSENPLFEALVAEVDGQILGMALYYPRYSTWKGKTLHLEDLIVSAAHRGKGIGMALYQAFLQEAAKQNVRRAEWVVLDWNQNAIDFYEKSGAVVLNDWKTVQMTNEQIKAFLNQ